MWGADSDFEGLMHQEMPIRLKVLPQAVVDVQLAFSSGERRLGMAKMLERLPKSFIERLPDKQQPLGFMTYGHMAFPSFSHCFWHAFRWSSRLILACFQLFSRIYHISFIYIQRLPTLHKIIVREILARFMDSRPSWKKETN